MFVKCRPFYLLREFTAIVIGAVYIPPCANAKDALRELYCAISEQQTKNPNGFFIIAGDFNHANLKTVLPKFYQHVNFATRGNNTLDFVYTTGKNAYKAVPRPHLGYSDHISVMLIPAYRPLLKLTKPVQKLITIWPENATSTVQDCFQCTDWNMFKEADTYNNHTDLQEYIETVTAYIKKCMDDVTVTKTITTRANQKPWMTAEVRGLLKTRDEAVRSGDKAALKTARANLSCGIKNAKRSYAQKINNHFTDSRDTRSLWQAIQTITDYKPPPQACDDDPSLPDTLNHFYSRFEMQNDTPAQKLPTPPNDQALCLSAADIRKTLSRINPRKAAGPDNIPGRVLKDCCTADGCPNRYLQHLAEPVSRPHMSQIHNDHTGTKEITCVLPKRLPSHSTDSNHNEVFWEVSHAKNQNQPPQHTRSAPVCIPSKPLYGRCNFHHPPPGSHPPRKQRLLC